MTLNHIHMYERVGPRGKEKIWRCAHPDCTHTIRKELIPGKRSQCSCGNLFILDAGALQRKVPKCMDCRDTQEAKAHRAAQLIIATAMGDAAEETIELRERSE